MEIVKELLPRGNLTRQHFGPGSPRQYSENQNQTPTASILRAARFYRLPPKFHITFQKLVFIDKPIKNKNVVMGLLRRVTVSSTVKNINQRIMYALFFD